MLIFVFHVTGFTARDIQLEATDGTVTMLRSTLALVCAFMLLGCSPRQDSDDPETNTRGDQGRHNSSEGQMSSSESKGTDANEQELIVVAELAWGYMQARLGAGGGEGQLVPIRTTADYEACASTMSDDGYLELSQHFPSRPASIPPHRC